MSPSILTDADTVDIQGMLFWVRKRIPNLKGTGGDSTSMEKTLVILLVVVCTIIVVVKLGNQVMASWSEVDRQLGTSNTSTDDGG